MIEIKNNIMKLFLLICFCLHFNSKCSLAVVTCYVCNDCKWEEGELEKCIYACQSINNSGDESTFNKGCSEDHNASPTCTDKFNCSCTSDHCNGINRRPKVTRSRSSLTSVRSSIGNGMHSTREVTTAKSTSHSPTQTKPYRNYDTTKLTERTTNSNKPITSTERQSKKFITHGSVDSTNGMTTSNVDIDDEDIDKSSGSVTEDVTFEDSGFAKEGVVSTEKDRNTPTIQETSQKTLVMETTVKALIHTVGKNGKNTIYSSEDNIDDDDDDDDDDVRSGILATHKLSSTLLSSSTSSKLQDHHTILGSTFSSKTVNNNFTSLSTTIQSLSSKPPKASIMTTMKMSNDVTKSIDNSSHSTGSYIDLTSIKYSITPDSRTALQNSSEWTKDSHNTTKQQTKHIQKVFTSTHEPNTNKFETATEVDGTKPSITFSQTLKPEQPVEDKFNEKPKYSETNEEEKKNHMFTIWTAIGSVFVALVLIAFIIMFVILFRKNKTYAIN